MDANQSGTATKTQSIETEASKAVEKKGEEREHRGREGHASQSTRTGPRVGMTSEDEADSRSLNIRPPRTGVSSRNIGRSQRSAEADEAASIDQKSPRSGPSDARESGRAVAANRERKSDEEEWRNPHDEKKALSGVAADPSAQEAHASKVRIDREGMAHGHCTRHCGSDYCCFSGGEDSYRPFYRSLWSNRYRSGHAKEQRRKARRWSDT